MNKQTREANSELFKILDEIAKQVMEQQVEKRKKFSLAVNVPYTISNSSPALKRKIMA